MPKTSSKSCNCINGCGNMLRRDDFSFISKVENVNPLTINPASGIPVKVYVCEKCGYLESYIATAEGFKI